jgi:hypothetical protein
MDWRYVNSLEDHKDKMLDEQWKEQIKFAYMICCHATMPLRNYQDKENAFRFVRSELEERYVTNDSYKEQIRFIRETFQYELTMCCDESGNCSCGEESE